MKQRYSILLAAVIGLTAASHAAPIAYEGFDYDAGTNLNGQAGGFGWATSWTNLALAIPVVSTPGMSYTGLSSSGGKADIIATTVSGGDCLVTRTLNTSFTSGSGVVWFSFLAQKTGTTTRFFNFSFYDAAGAERLKIGRNSNQAQTWFINDGNSSLSVNTGASCTNETLFVGKLTFDESTSNNDRLELWLNPNLALGESGLGTAFEATSNWDFNRIRLAAGGGNNASGGIYDEIRFGTTFNDVAGASLTRYDLWALEYGLTEGRNAKTDDPDSDGASNYVEYLLNGNPTNSANKGQFFIEPIGASVNVIFAQRTDESAVTYSLVDKEDLIAGTETTNAYSSQTSGPSGSANYDSVTNTYTMGNKQFFKVVFE
jgi:hypothetical protein